MTNKKKIVILCIIGILIVFIVTLGITYAFMKPKVEAGNSNTNIEISSCAKVQLKDTNSKTIDLKNTYPMDDEKGLETIPYEFTVTSTCDDYFGFNLYLTSLTTNEIADEALKFAITNISGYVLATNVLNKDIMVTDDFSVEELNQLDLGIKGTHKNIYKVFSDSIPLKGESTYKLYLWINKDFEDNISMNKKLTVGVSIKSFKRDKTMAELCAGQKVSECFPKNYKLDGSIIYHNAIAALEDGIENSDKVAGDDSYRFVGANPNNYVCFGSACSNEGTDPNYKNLYRIIGLFKNKSDQYEMKIIKADAATKEDLGDALESENSVYHYDVLPESQYYKGKLTKLAWYYWNNANGRGSSANNVNMWKDSNLNTKILNETYYNSLEEPYKTMVVEHEWQVGGYSNLSDAKGTYDYELGNNKIISTSKNCYTQGNPNDVRECNLTNDLTYSGENAHVGLMYISDYMYATLPEYWTTMANNYKNEDVKNNNWLHLGIFEWVISRYTLNGIFTRTINPNGVAHSVTYVYFYYSVRPVLYLTSDVKITGGYGTETDPFQLEV